MQARDQVGFLPGVPFENALLGALNGQGAAGDRPILREGRTGQDNNDGRGNQQLAHGSAVGPRAVA